MTKERPILFSAPMVRAILEGRKTVTRRVVKPQPYIDASGNFCWNGRNFGQNFDGPLTQAIASPLPCSKTKRVLCPYGKPGDRLWVREAHSFVPDDDEPAGCSAVLYAADGNQYGKIRPSIHMPRWASRILLEVTAVRVERLQDISEGQAQAEGAEPYDVSGFGTDERALLDAPLMEQGSPYRNGFALLWESINGAGSWEANPWVWVVEFRRLPA